MEVSGGLQSEDVEFARRFGGVPSFGSSFFQKPECVLCATFWRCAFEGPDVFRCVRRLSPTCFGAWKIPARGNMRLTRRFRCVLEVQTCLDIPHN